LTALLITLAVPVHAEYYYQYVSYSCDAKRDRLTLNYATIPYEGDYKPDKRRNQWEMRSLIERKEDDRAHAIISKITKVIRYCKLSSGTYKITIAPAPGNYDLEGQCGAHMSAWVEVSLEGKKLLPAYTFDDYCINPESKITTQIILKPGTVSPVFKKMPR